MGVTIHALVDGYPKAAAFRVVFVSIVWAAQHVVIPWQMPGFDALEQSVLPGPLPLAPMTCTVQRRRYQNDDLTIQ